MAPSFPSPTTGVDTRSALLTTSSIVTPVIIIASSAAGISSILFFAILAVTLHRRIRSRQHARLKTVPRLVITDTSMFPASTVVVDGGADLDKVIASFRPLGADLYENVEEVAASDAVNIHNCDEEDEGDDQLFPLPISPRPKPNSMPISGPTCNCNFVTAGSDAISLRNGRQVCTPARLSSCQYHTDIEEGVWWYDFHREESLDSTSTLSEVVRIASSESLYSASSSDCDAQTKLKVSACSPATTIPALDQIVGVASELRECAIGVVKCDPADDSGDKSEDTLYDEDILAYCWTLSGNGSGRTHGSLSSLCDAEAIVKDPVTTTASQRSKAVSIRTCASSGAFDQRILEYCWKLSDNSSLRSTDSNDQLSAAVSARVRFTAAARTVSNASVPGYDFMRLHDSGHIIYPIELAALQQEQMT